MVVTLIIKILSVVIKPSESGINFIGMGVSGGEVGALTGPSLMPGGQEAYNKVSDILDAIVAKAKDGASCRIYWTKWSDITLKWFIMALNMQICNLLQRACDDERFIRYVT